jgi:hypothetical protein
MKLQILGRKLHYWLSIGLAAPILVIVVSGLLLQVKKHSAWVQPTEQRGLGGEPAVSFAEILEICKAVPEAQVAGWEDVHRLDVRPERGLIKVSAKNHWEVQIDSHTGEVLQVAYRRSDIIESIHDGSWFHSWAKLGLFLPAGIVLLLLWVTGIYLFFLPILRKRRRRGPAPVSGVRPPGGVAGPPWRRGAPLPRRRLTWGHDAWPARFRAVAAPR